MLKEKKAELRNKDIQRPTTPNADGDPKSIPTPNKDVRHVCPPAATSSSSAATSESSVTVQELAADVELELLEPRLPPPA
jgi:hypothetical protein